MLAKVPPGPFLKMNLKDKKLWSIIASVVFGILLLIIILFKYPFKEVFSTFTNFTPLLVLAYLVVSVLIIASLSLRWRIILKAMGHKVPFHKLFGYRVIGYGVSYITPAAKVGGEPVRAALLKRQNISFKEGLSSIIIDKTLELSITLFFFVIGVVFFLLDYALPGKILFLLVLLALLFIFLIWKFYSRLFKGKPVFADLFMFFRLHKIRFLSKYYDKILSFEKPIIKFYQSQRKEFLIATGISIISLFLSLAEYKLVLLMFGLDINLGLVFLVFSMVGIAFLIPLPMALGSLEAFLIFLFSVINLGPAAAGVGIAMVTRSRDLLWVLGALILSFYLGSLKNIVKKAFGDKPVVEVGVFRRGTRHSLDIKINRPSVKQSRK